MLVSPRLRAIALPFAVLPFAVLLFAALLALPAAASAAGALPDPPANLLDTPTVGITPTGSGAVVEVGAGDTTVQVGAGTGGVTVATRPRGSSPATTIITDPGQPVSTPGDRPGRVRSPLGKGPRGVVFGPRSGGAVSPASNAAGSAATQNAARPGSTSAPGSGRRSTSEVAGGNDQNRSSLPPFLELVEQIPTALIAGIVALALIAIAVWAAWVRDRRRLAHNAFLDPVTGVANSAALAGLLGGELERAKRYKRPLALVVLEVSEMQRSRLPLMDQRLRDVTEAIRSGVRDSDIVGRLGLSRFAVVCPEATAPSAQTLARGLELRLEEMRVHVAAGSVERQATDMTADHILARAEAAVEAPRGDSGQPAAPRVLQAA
jgi:diguanylate cyclase (GGDEF)-like protein